MELFDKRNGEAVTIYGVVEDKIGYPKFLIRKDNEWRWDSAKHYITEKERIHTAYAEWERHEIEQYGRISSSSMIQIMRRNNE